MLLVPVPGLDQTDLELALPPGRRRVTARTTDGRAASAVVDVGATSELVLRLAPAGSVRLRHDGPEDYLDIDFEDVDGVPCGLERTTSGIDDVVLLPPGDWFVRAAGRPTRRVHVEAGVETCVEF